MSGLCYQLKSVLHDKFCLMTFLLPIVVATALHFAGTMDLSTLGELHFGVLQNALPPQTVTWLERYGQVTFYDTEEELTAAVNEPSTNLIGVEAKNDGIATILSGDELEIFRETADTLPALYDQRSVARQAKVRILKRPDVMAGFRDIFIASIMIAAMFMGCTFNAMNIISEKEDGIALINAILPMSSSEYILQKIFVGFVCGSLSSVITACICFRLTAKEAFFMLALILLSGLSAALAGLFIGRFSAGLMTGVVYIKIVMLLFIAVPLLSYLAGASGPVLTLCYLVPSQATFAGIMDLAAGKTAAWKNVWILVLHCGGGFLLYGGISAGQKRNG